MSPNINSRGFTLVEVLVALCCMSIAFAAFIGLHMSSLKLDRNTNNESRAYFLANQRMETLRSTALANYSALASGGPMTDGPYTVTWAVAPDPTGTGSQVNVTASWVEHMSLRNAAPVKRPRSVSVYSILVDLR